MQFKRHPKGYLHADGSKGTYLITGKVFKILKLFDGFEINKISTHHNEEDAIAEANELEQADLLERLNGSMITEEVVEL